MDHQRIDFKRLKQRAHFRPVLEHYGLAPSALRARDFIQCPFHTEENPSCRINVERKTFRCFGCGAKGSILDFVARMEHCGLSQAAKIIASCCHLSDEELSSASADVAGGGLAHLPPPPLHEDGRNDPLRFRLSLDPLHPYLAGRGVVPEVARHFGIGYCDRGVMRNRIAIPIHDADGNLVAYAGRWAADEIPYGVPRYLLPRNFRKRQVLYNLHRVRNTSVVWLVESYWSVFRLSTLGVAAIALMGRELSEEQLELLRSAGIDRLGLMLDGDGPGRSATVKMLPALAREFFVRDLQLPNGLKPHSAAEEAIRNFLRFV